VKKSIFILFSIGSIFSSVNLSADSNEFSRMSSCPSSPNCVSTTADPMDKEHYINPYEYNVSRQEAYEILLSYLKSEKGVQIVESEDFYIHAVFTTKIMRFKDDVEFHFPEARQMVDLKSASRIGYGDMGKNRKRIEEIRDILKENFTRKN
jgi:uncharacterized protein (DUF1499 family)